MTTNQTIILIILVFTMAMFLWGRWRHDMIAVGALLACVLTGLIAAADAFTGFGHPAVISVACILILSRSLQTSGAVNVLVRYTLPKNAGPTLNLVALVGLGAALSGFMNNVGAMALLMPVAIQLAERLDLPPGRILMPLAFGTILGGMTTMIGTPPNLIVSGFRAQSGDGSFGMFDFTPVGLAVALSGVIFIAIVGWRLVPMRKQTGMEGFETGAYITEVRVSADSKAAGMIMHELETILDEHAAQVVGLVRNEAHLTALRAGFKILPNDILIIEAEVEVLAHILSSLGLSLEEADTHQHNDKERKYKDAKDLQWNNNIRMSNEGLAAVRSDEAEEEKESSQSDEIILMEFVVRPESTISGRSAADMRLRTRYGLNLLAVSREGTRAKTRLRTLKIQPGDLLLLQGTAEVLAEFAADFGCVPLANRELHIPDTRKALIAGGIMVVAVSGAAFGLLPAAISFAIGVLATMVFRIVPPRAIYDAIDWPVIVLLGALIPVAGVLESTGMADLVARFMIDNIVQGHAIMGLLLILVITMFLSDLMNNAATAAVMCPIAIGTATALGVNADSFLMAVAIGASCAFLTPIGHQNNTLILGPGGFRFGDYWQLGLPIEILVVIVSIPLLLIFWPL